MAEHDMDFYRRRLVEELQREADAATPEARSAHGLLAALYSDRVREIVALSPKPAQVRHRSGPA